MQLDVPQKTGTLVLAETARTAFAAVLNGGVGVTVAEVDEPQLDGLTGSAEIFEKLGSTDLTAAKEIADKIHPYVASGKRLDSSIEEIVSQLPDASSPSYDAAWIFGDLYALVAAKGKLALSTSAELTMWYQRLLGNGRVKLATEILKRIEFDAKHEGVKVQPKEPKEFVEKPKESKPEVETKSEPKAAEPEAKEAKSEQKAAETKAVETEPVEVKTEAEPETKVEETKESKPEAEKVTIQPVDTSKPVQLYQAPEHPILPKQGEKNYLITSALPYVNNVPHLGNIIGSTLSADFFSRWTKGRGYNSLYICGTDEYGTATETKAIEEKVTPLELCTKYHKVHKEVYEWFQIGFDHFGRTSTPQQTKICQEMFLECQANGYLEEKSTEQLYCTEHNGFLADRFVEGTCPKCGYEDARGDQCDKCGLLLDPFELINPRCKLDNASPEKRETKHLFISLDKLQSSVEKFVRTKESTWSNNAKQITNAWFKEGLLPRAITRDLKWGVPVPVEGYEDKVLYVWFDAPIGYPSITANYTDEWKQWWGGKDVSLYQFMGKDNVPFHSVIFPATQIATGKPWTMIDTLSTTEYLQYEGGKFSKSRNLGVFGNNAQEIGVSPSVWRYYLASVRPETADSQFSWLEFVTRNNSELLANFGNLVNRVVKFGIAKLNATVPEYDPTVLGSSYTEFAADITTLIALYNTHMSKCELRSGCEVMMRISSRGNQFLQDNKLDNSLLENEPAKCHATIGTALSLIYILSAICAPFMPETSQKILEQLNLPARLIPDEFDIGVPAGTKLGPAQYLFVRIDKDNVQKWQAQFGGEKKAEEEEKPKKKKKSKKKKAAKKPEEEGETESAPSAPASAGDAAAEAETK